MLVTAPACPMLIGAVTKIGGHIVQHDEHGAHSIGRNGMGRGGASDRLRK